eukprot:GEZU01014255.1.p3 GENE.GEZU01014255.1~~GEZU01014255.1.p3  ORF type:complete len:138 (-),score=32.94 GEZU01014255.1:40-453(-)
MTRPFVIRRQGMSMSIKYFPITPARSTGQSECSEDSKSVCSSSTNSSSQQAIEKSRPIEVIRRLRRKKKSFVSPRFAFAAEAFKDQTTTITASTPICNTTTHTTTNNNASSTVSDTTTATTVNESQILHNNNNNRGI